MKAAALVILYAHLVFFIFCYSLARITNVQYSRMLSALMIQHVLQISSQWMFSMPDVCVHTVCSCIANCLRFLVLVDWQHVMSCAACMCVCVYACVPGSWRMLMMYEQ